MVRAFGTMLILYAAIGAGEMRGVDLSSYRQFHLGVSLETVTKQIHAPITDARTVHVRPALIQEIAWQPQYQSSTQASRDPVDQILFSFSDSRLFQVVVIYNRTSIEGLTVEDIIERVSLDYGIPVRPENIEIMFPTSFRDSGEVLARWEDQKAALNLVRSAYRSIFGLILVSKELEPAAREASAESVRLDESEAPEREAEARRVKEEEARVRDEQSRRLNKPTFRP